MEKRKKVMHTYDTNVDMKWSMDYRVRATSVGEARAKIWKRFCKHPPKKCFDFLVGRKD